MTRRHRVTEILLLALIVSAVSAVQAESAPPKPGAQAAAPARAESIERLGLEFLAAKSPTVRDQIKDPIN